MILKLLTSADDLALYDVWVSVHPQGNLWQSMERAYYHKMRGKETRIYAVFGGSHEQEITAAALVLIDTTSGGLSTWEIARGPLWTDEHSARKLIEHVIREAKTGRALSVSVSPLVPLNLQEFRFTQSGRHVHAEATRVLDLTRSEEELLADMHQKGRYNIKVAQKNGIQVEQAIDIMSYAKLAKETAVRDGFTAVSALQYRAFLEHQPGSFLLLAYAPDSRKPVAGLLGIVWPGFEKVKPRHGIYYYGASDYEHRALMAPYLLQWEAIKHCKALGCAQYDLLGIAPLQSTVDPLNQNLQPKTSSPHPWSGISDFKAKFGGTVVTYPAEQELVLKPMMKKVLQMKRKLLG
jgi:peptidoglycan pentaglycine glycine transferase (the first glycine)